MMLWLFYWIGASSALAIAALLAERALRWHGRAARGVWIGLLTLTALPVALLLTPALPSAANGGLIRIGALQVIGGPTGPVASAVLAGAAWDGWIFALWGLASILVLLRIAHAAGRLAGARSQWTRGRVGDREVWLSDDTGPAVAGVLRPEIVLPSWIDTIGEQARTMMLAHEEEHLRAGDTRTLLAGYLLVALVPWNPVAWWGVRRLHQAIEADCDQRVLRRGFDLRQYAQTLLHVAGRAGPARLALTLGERTENLERRPRAMTMNRANARAASTALTPAAALLIPAALWALPAPGAPALPGTGADTGEPALETAHARTPPVAASDTAGADHPRFFPRQEEPQLANRQELIEALQSGYPTGLQEEGIEGTTVLWLFVSEEGIPQEVRIADSSGDDRLDEVAVEAARVARFTPAINRDQPLAVWVQFPLTFAASAQD